MKYCIVEGLQGRAIKIEIKHREKRQMLDAPSGERCVE